MSLLDRLKASIQASVGDIVFGMEDGTVSIFGLVFGVALSAPDSRTVLLAGATGAAAAAVSMMAGSYLDAESERDAALAQATPPPEKAEETAASVARIAERLAASGVSHADSETLRQALVSTPGAMAAIRQEIAPPKSPAHASPAAHATWMFVADLFAGAVPVIPFALLPLRDARLASLAVTTALLLALGIGRGLVAGRNILRTTLETLLVAAAAAAAGVAIGRMIA
ncbi:MAG: VIT1/CCC1 transporter family protein [Xanthobacteraceae bacterium]